MLNKEEGINVEIERLGTAQTHHHGWAGSFAKAVTGFALLQNPNVVRPAVFMQ